MGGSLLETGSYGSRSRGRRRSCRLVFALAALSLVLVACGDDDESISSNTVVEEPGEDNSGGGLLAEAAAYVEEHSDPIEDWPAPPDSPMPEAGKKLFVISIDQQLEGAVRGAEGAMEAAEILEWDSVLIDGQSSPDAMLSGVERAIREKADGIVLIYINQEFISSGVEQARSAGIPVVSVLGGNEPGPSRVNADAGSGDYTTELGRALGYYVVNESGGNATAVVLDDTSFVLSRAITAGYREILEQCEGCEIAETVEFTSADVTTRLPSLVGTAITRNADVDWVLAPYDAAATFAVQGVQDAGTADVKVGGTGGNLPNLEAIRQGGIQTVTIGQTLEWPAFAAVDNLNRIMHGEEPVTVDLPLRILYEGNLPPEGQAWTGDVDFVSMYRDLWGK